MIDFEAYEISEKKKLDLICDIDPGVPQFIMGDSTRLRQILFNILRFEISLKILF